MITAEVIIYGKDGKPVWEQKKVVPNIVEGLDYLCAIRATIHSVYLTSEGHMIDMHLHDSVKAQENGSS